MTKYKIYKKKTLFRKELSEFIFTNGYKNKILSQKMKLMKID